MKLKYNNSKKSIILNGTTYKAYSVCDLPNNFGFHDKEPIVHLRTKDAVTEWFNYAGLTYIFKALDSLYGKYGASMGWEL